MSLLITSLNSGSNGNCYYVGNNDEAILIDAGISCKETEKRMHMLGLSMQLVKAIFISHEHSDHIRGLQVLADKYRMPIYITDITLRHSGISFSQTKSVSFQPYQSINIGNLSVTPFPKHHDAGDPHSFIIESSGVKVGVFTDIGSPCTHVIKAFKRCHAAFLESNYDETLLENGRYPYYLKNRIRGGKGHLSNSQALDIFLKHRPPYMSHLLLSHLSKDNNCPEMVKNLFEPHARQTKIIIASRYEQTPVFQVGVGYSRRISIAPPVNQLTLF